MSKIELPPQPTFERVMEIAGKHDTEKNAGLAAFARELMDVYGEACARAALERAAQIAENAHPDDWPFIAAAIRSEIERDRARLASLPKPAIQAHIWVETA